MLVPRRPRKYLRAHAYQTTSRYSRYILTSGLRQPCSNPQLTRPSIPRTAHVRLAHDKSGHRHFPAPAHDLKACAAQCRTGLQDHRSGAGGTWRGSSESLADGDLYVVMGPTATQEGVAKKGTIPPPMTRADAWSSSGPQTYDGPVQARSLKLAPTGPGAAVATVSARSQSACATAPRGTSPAHGRTPVAAGGGSPGATWSPCGSARFCHRRS